MPYKDPAKRRAAQKVYSRAYYERNKELHRARSRRSSKSAKDKWNAFKSSLACHHCGIQHPVLIDFHHIDRTPPKHAVNKLVQSKRFKAAMEEVKKCIPLCANCHRLVHHDERQAEKALRKRKKP